MPVEEAAEERPLRGAKEEEEDEEREVEKEELVG